MNKILRKKKAYMYPQLFKAIVASHNTRSAYTVEFFLAVLRKLCIDTEKNYQIIVTFV